MHEGAVCREIMDIVSDAAIENEIQRIYEIVPDCELCGDQ